MCWAFNIWVKDNNGNQLRGRIDTIRSLKKLFEKYSLPLPKDLFEETVDDDDDSDFDPDDYCLCSVKQDLLASNLYANIIIRSLSSCNSAIFKRNDDNSIMIIIGFGEDDEKAYKKTLKTYDDLKEVYKENFGSYYDNNIPDCDNLEFDESEIFGAILAENLKVGHTVSFDWM